MAKVKAKPGVIIGLVILLIPAIIAMNTWLVMLVFGAMGHIFEVHKLFISFWQAIVVTLALGIVGSFFKGNNSTK